MSQNLFKNESSIREATLRIKCSFGAIIGLTVLFLTIIAFSSEAIFRSELVRSLLPSPSTGSTNKSLDIKLWRLESLARNEGSVECIFLGNSMVNAGIDPDSFRDSYKTATGEDISCFNFGINALSPSTFLAFADILVKRYTPRLLILGTCPLDFAKKERDKSLDTMMKNPWVRYQRGKKSIEGFLCENSYAYRYFLRFRIWMEYPGFSKGRSYVDSIMSPYGYRKNRTKSISKRAMKPVRRARFIQAISDFRVDSASVRYLGKVIDCNSRTSLVLVEMPLHPSVFELGNNYLGKHIELLEEIDLLTERRGVAFFRTTNLNFIPDQGWLDYYHLNYEGAKIFSRWLGRQIGEAVNKGLIEDPQKERP